MDKRYEVFCLADRYFYETPDRLSVSRPTAENAAAAEIAEGGAAGTARGIVSSFYEPAQRPAPDGWRTLLVGDWLHVNPVDAAGAPRPGRPLQGWKIHVSACLDNAEKIAAQVWDYCVPRAVPFKFVPGPHQLHLRNSKYAGRGSSGKFVTIYPADEKELHAILLELGALLDGEPGPYILTDLRWRRGPLYVRYGGFVHRYCVDGTGALVPAIEHPDGHLVPDRREPAFHVPDWVTLPDFLAPELAARNATTTDELPYRIERALHFSNGGGVYAGRDLRTGDEVVLKEARPHAGLASDRADAVARLEREKTALERLSGLGVAPEVRDWFTLGDHRFLVMDFLPGRPLNSFFAQRHPLLAPDPEPGEIAEYSAWALDIHRAVEEAVAAVHGRGVVFNDLHMFNVMVAPDEKSVRLLDFEAAAHVDENHRQALAHPGFIAPTDRRGFDVDRYALACLRLALFMPMTTLLVIDRDKAAHLAEVAAARFPDVPAEFWADAVREITRDPDAREHVGEPAPGASSSGASSSGTPARSAPASDTYLPVDPGDWPAARDSMAAAVLASATPERDDRLFPGDIAQFGDGGGLGLAHGAAGVLYALAEAGLPAYEAGEEWLLRHTDPPPPGTPLGLYDGLAGTALVLDRLGHPQRALDLVRRVLDEKWQRLVPDLYGGLAGIGLVLDHLSRSTGEKELRASALRAAQLLADRLTDPDAAPTRRAGLLYGATGPALLFLRLYDHSPEPALLDLAATALRKDLAQCVTSRHGALLVDEGRRIMPYLGGGSVGIGMVLDDHLAHRPSDAEFEDARAAILPAAHSHYYAQPGLFNGRAGMVLHLSRTTAPGAAGDRLARQIAGLGWYAIPYRGHLAFPGDQMMRLSMDLATGTAGCLLALAAAHGPATAQLPFLPRLPRPPRSTRPTSRPPSGAE
ncbi:class III lanthionine synthetase LanKC [Streptomyces sp. URMC 123]|uniref:class III lanthionine synthetase LanKC n=1 Tax=Streptomyces sp. URMC 123 TaxID=3423403 RepID=UPI003F1B8AF9